MATEAARSQRAAVIAAGLLLGATLVRVLTLDLPPDRRAVEVAASVVALGYGALMVRLRSMRQRRGEDLIVILSGLVPALIAGLMAFGARDQLGSLDVVLVLLFAAIAVAIPAGASVAAYLTATLAVDSVLIAVWLLWSGHDALTLGLVLAAITALQAAALAKAMTAAAAAQSEKLRSVAHSTTAVRVGTAIDVLSVTRAVLENGHQSYPVTSEAFVLLYDQAADRLRPLPLYLGPRGVTPVEADNLDFSLAPHEGLAGKVFAASRPMLWPTAFDVEAGQANLGEQTRLQLLALRRGVVLSAIGAPLMIDDEVTGVYMLHSHRQELAWDEQDFTVVSALAAEAARAIERARRYERDLDQAHLDSITGLASHRQLTRTLDQEVARARRRDTSLGVLFCDLDRFKAVNDTYGHAAGDRVLTILARVFHESLRREDSAARYGGDEFVCVLPGADRTEADAVGRRVADGFAARVREDPELRTAGVTISCGVAIFPSDGDGVESLLNHADSAMRVVKARHRAASLNTR